LKPIREKIVDHERYVQSISHLLRVAVRKFFLSVISSADIPENHSANHVFFDLSFTHEMQGGRVFAPLIISIIAYILFAITAFSCDSFEYTDPQDDSSTYKYGYWGVIGIDLSGDETCHSLNDIADEWVALGGSKDEIIDGPLKAGRAIGVTGAILGGLFLILLALTPFMVIHKSILIVSGNIVGIFMGLFSPTLYVGLFTDACVEDDNDNYYNNSESSSGLHCAPTGKGYLASGAFILWIIGTSIVCCCMGKPRTTDDDAQFAMGTDKEYVNEGASARNLSEFNNTEVELEGSNPL